MGWRIKVRETARRRLLVAEITRTDAKDEDATPPASTPEQGTSSSLLNEVNHNSECSASRSALEIYNVPAVIGRTMAGAKAALARAQRETQDAFARYTACLDTEAQIRQQLSIAEERRDGLSECNTASGR